MYLHSCSLIHFSIPLDGVGIARRCLIVLHFGTSIGDNGIMNCVKIIVSLLYTQYSAYRSCLLQSTGDRLGTSSFYIDESK